MDVKESEYQCQMRCVAFFAIVISTAAVIVSVITLPMLYSFVANLQSHLVAETDFCKVSVATDHRKVLIMSGVASVPELLLSYMQLTGTVAVQRAPHLFAALAMILQVAAADLLEEVRQYLENNWAFFVQFETDLYAPRHYAQQMAQGRCHDLLIEAVCRMKGIQIMARRLHEPIGNSAIFGCRGPIFEVVEVNDQWYALNERIVPWTERAHGLLEPGQAVDITESGRPGTSRENEKTRVKQITSGKICKSRPNPKVKLFAKLSHCHRTVSAAQKRAACILRLAKKTLRHRVQLDRDIALVDITPLAQRTAGVALIFDDTSRESGQEVVAEVAPEGNGDRLESGLNENVNQVVVPRAEDPVGEVLPAGQESEPDAVNPDPDAHLGGDDGGAGEAGPSMPPPPVELIELPGPPYELVDGAYVCRLPQCPLDNKRFGSLKAWKLHASHTRTHIAQGYCTGCNHFVVAPPEADPVEMRVWLRAHKQERCGSASRQVIKERRRELLRLEALRRDATHLLLPGTLEEADGAERRVTRKRVYPTEDERRLGLCLCYVKHFKATNPGLLQEIAADFDLSFA